MPRPVEGLLRDVEAELHRGIVGQDGLLKGGLLGRLVP